MTRMRALAVPVLAAALGLATATTAGAAATPTITKAEYDKVKLGSSVTTLHTAAGRGACKLIDDTTSGGVRVKIYKCKGDKPFSQADFVFANNKLEARSQVLLDGGKSNGLMTKAKYRKITAGKTIAQMHEIAGKGTCIRVGQSEVQGYKVASYDCDQARPAGAASFLFENGKLTTRAQSGLR
ncbi:hypothetical protein LG634_30360 [Streptomyces bambusae]|uniref:hypothetical protein n=1 Tax=Streptomyces bambusae TaxID=1550616 RepID=UPI001D0013B1|nr:hypothetical protein [Streptomyces bambusae]MCB5169098.1 hypothetical protein [Streptomyces bambusae]